MILSSLRRRIEKLERDFAHHDRADELFVRSSNRDRAIKTAREVLKYEQAGITITPSETINLSREYLKALRLSEKSS
jgi:hypothetical protein